MDPLDELLGESRKIVALRQKARAMLQHYSGARRPPPILIQGETGTGKGLLARLMHRTGPRANGPFIDLSCAAIPETLLEAELFGYERGAFTDARQSKPGLFQVAHGGTLFLDEVGLLPRALQAKLLTVLEQGSVRRLGATRSEPANVSIVAATNESLLSCVRDGRFREDLYHRLAVLTLELPPLRERRDDVELLAGRFLTHMCAEYNLPAKSMSEDARGALRAYDWPGNVRELSNVLERAVLLSDTDSVAAADLELRDATSPGLDRPLIVLTPEDANRERLTDALRKTGWNITRTATVLGIARNTVRARIRHYGLRPMGDAGPRSVPAAPGAAPASEPTVSPRAERAEPPVADVRWGRRRVTFMSARIVADPETQSAIATRILSRMVEKVQSFGGRVNEVGQRSVLAIFGQEPAEDAPRRAASVAIAITRAVERERLDGRLAADVSVAIGIHVEHVVVARIAGQSVIDQDATRQATRVLKELEPDGGGEIAVSATAAGFLIRHFDIQPSAHVPGARHRLVARWPTPAGGQPAAFIGRQPEIDLLRSLLDRAMSGQGQIVTIVGEPGIGKSRLLHEFREAVRSEGVVVLEGRCTSYGTHVPYFPVLEVLQTVCGVEEADPSDVVDAKVLAALRPLGDTGVASAPFLQYLLFPRKSGELRGRSPDAIKAKTFEAIRQIVLAQQEHRTLVLVTEDLQWIDQTSQDLLSSLASAITGSRVILVTTARPGYQAPWSTQSNATQVAVGPLSLPESRELVESLLGDRPSDETLVARILGRGEGNPFFLEELTRAAREQPDAPTHLAVPGTVHDVLATRIDALTDADRTVLDVAAVIGRDVGVGLVQEASGLPPDGVRASLGRLQAADFLSASRFGAESEYRFKHALTHDVAYESVSEESRVSLHAQVAAAIEKLAPESRERRPEVLARHYTVAARPLEAIDCWCRAGQLAIQRSAHGDAMVHLAQALRLLAEQPEGAARAAQEVRAQLAIATSLSAARGYAVPELERTLDRIRTLAGQLHDPAQEFSVRWTLWRFQISRADFRRAEELAVQLLSLAAGQEDPVGSVAAHVAAGVDKFYVGDFADAQHHLARAVGFYEREQTDAQRLRYGQDLGVAAWGFLGWVEAVVGDLRGALARVEHLLELARGINHPFSLALGLFLACEIHEQRHDPAAVRRLADELVALSREHSFTFFSAIGLMHRGWAEATAGDVGAGVALMREGAGLFRAVGQRVGLAHRARLAEGLIASGAVDEALAVIADAVDQWRQTDEHAFAAVHLRLRGEALVRHGDVDEAQRAFREAIDVASRQGAWLFALRAAIGLARLDPHAREILAGITRRFPPTPPSPELDSARALLEQQP
ncbi:MAG TPA: sigma 54-interacting transcriptional regulator [Methylomirabilota bacterium]|nr:sigma 54-interacting transcriptional regulator [Methylomirabilota bacterium]